MAGTKAGAAKRRHTQPAPPAAVTEERVELHPVYVVPPKRYLLHEGKRLEAGDVVPGAHLWPRIETWINTGRIVEKT